MPASRFQKLLLEELHAMRKTKRQLVKALPKMARATADPLLKAGLLQRLEEAKGQLAQVEKAFEVLGAEPKGEAAAVLQSLAKSGLEAWQNHGESLAASREMAGAGTLADECDGIEGTELVFPPPAIEERNGPAPLPAVPAEEIDPENDRAVVKLALAELFFALANPELLPEG